MPRDTNALGSIFGGVILSHIDLAAAVEAHHAHPGKLVKEIGAEIAADPELGPDILQPLKSQGVMSTDDSALVVRAKYMARPGDAAWMIRRMAYEKILNAFAENGIEFASRRVSVYVPPGADEDVRRKTAAAAVANDPGDAASRR